MKETAPYADILFLNIEGNGKRIRYSLIMYLNNQLSRRGEQQADRHRRRELFINLKRNNMGTNKQLSIKQIICFNIIAAEKVAGDVCQGLAVKLAKEFIYHNRDMDANEISYISRQCEIALQNIFELGLTEAKNNEMNNIIAKYNGNE